MSLRTVAIELLSDRIDLAVMKGSHVSARRRIAVNLPLEATAWAKAVSDQADTLRAAVEELGARGASARLLYRSPSQAVDLASFELRSAAQACDAAVLPCLEALPYSPAAARCEALAIGRDRSGPNRRWHVVVAAERSDVARALVDTVEAAGLTFESLLPIDATFMARIVKRALTHEGPQHGWLHFGKYSSFFVIGGQGRVRFERSIALGVETIVQSLSRPIRVPDEEPVELGPAAARKIVYRHGIPESEEPVHEQPRLTRAHIMPQIQPVLQRYVVELRQSLRFGLPENERDAIDISVSGPGSSVPGLCELIAWELKLDIVPDAAYAGFDPDEPAGKGTELVDAMDDRSVLTRLNLQPADTATRKQISRLRRWMWAGAAAGLVVVGFDGMRLGARLRDSQREETRLTAAVTELQSLEKTHKKLMAALAAMNELEVTVSEEIGVHADLKAILQELSLLAPESVRLNSIRFTREQDVLVARLYGGAEHLDGQGRTELESFIEAIKKSPLFANAVLKNVEVGTAGGRAGQRFEATFDVILTPEVPVQGELAAGGEGGEP